MTMTFDDIRKIVTEVLGFDPTEAEMGNRAKSIEILTRGAHNYALDKAARVVCATLKSCETPKDWPTGHHPYCDQVRSAILREKAR